MTRGGSFTYCGITRVARAMPCARPAAGPQRRRPREPRGALTRAPPAARHPALARARAPPSRLNAHNAQWAWRLLEREHALATAALEDCRWGPVGVAGRPCWAEPAPRSAAAPCARRVCRGAICEPLVCKHAHSRPGRDTCATGREYEELVQRALAANAGMGFEEWGALLGRAARGALARLAGATGGSGGAGGEGVAVAGEEEGGSDSGAAARLQARLELQRAARLLRALLRAAARAERRNAAAAAEAAAAAARRAGGGALRAAVFDLPGRGAAGGAAAAAGDEGGGGSCAGALGPAGGGGSWAGLDLGPLEEAEEKLLPPWASAAAALLRQALLALGPDDPGGLGDGHG